MARRFRRGCRRPSGSATFRYAWRSLGGSQSAGERSSRWHQTSLRATRKPYEQITGICGGDLAEAERFGVSRRRSSRLLWVKGCQRADRTPRDLRLRDGLVHQFVVLPVLDAGRRYRRLLPARRLGAVHDLSRPALGQAGLGQKLSPHRLFHSAVAAIALRLLNCARRMTSSVAFMDGLKRANSAGEI